MARFLTGVREIAWNREFRTIRGDYRGVAVAATSTGIGGPSAAIAVEELVRTGATTLIRIGSAGALQPGLGVGDLVVPWGAVRQDGTTATYVDPAYPAAAHPAVFDAIVHAARDMGLPVHTGITRSHDSFYTSHEEQVTAEWHKRGVLASDMETAALFVVGGLRGARCGSILNVVVSYGGDLETGVNQLQNAEERAWRGEENEIRLALEALGLLAGAAPSEVSQERGANRK